MTDAYPSVLLDVDGIMVRVTWKPIRTVRLRVVPPDGRVELSAPEDISTDQLEDFIRKHHAWVVRNQSRIRMTARVAEPIVDGGRVKLWGQWRELVVVDGKLARARLVDGRVHVTVPSGDKTAGRRALESLYRRELHPRVQGLLTTWQPRVGREAGGIKLRRMSTRWGTCNTRTGMITLNTALAERDPASLEYVVVHELVHLLERGHGRAFKGWMDRLLPDWTERRRTLRGAA